MVNVGIVGVGLIGGSLGLALRRIRKSGKRKYRVFGLGRSRQRLLKAKKKGAVDFFSTEPDQVLSDVDILVLAVPAQNMAAMTRRILPFVKKGAILTDVGSVKAVVEKDLRGELQNRKDLSFVGGHPLAGSEKTGIAYATADLFKGAVVVLTPALARGNAVRMVQSLWTDAGAETLVMKSSQHDEMVALTSHLPHLLAFSLFSLASRQFKKSPVLKSLAPRSFRDMTRIVGSDPAIWTGVIDFNRRALKKRAVQFNDAVRELLTADSRDLFKVLKKLSLEKIRWSK